MFKEITLAHLDKQYKISCFSMHKSHYWVQNQAQKYELSVQIYEWKECYISHYLPLRDPINEM